MGVSRYWNILRISPNAENLGYKQYLIPSAQEYFYKKLPLSQEIEVQDVLISTFRNRTLAKIDLQSCVQAGLCLRCYISYPIVKACQKIDHLFGNQKYFTYHDLLSFVLDDDGETSIILDKDGKNQLIVKENGETELATYRLFSVKILQTFNADSQQKMSLDNWVYLQTKQQPELKTFLAEFGFQPLSDWALLNRVRPKQLERLSARDRHLVEVFHAVYRRDRQKQYKVGARKCPDPSNAQLQEMLAQLQKRNITINSPTQLLQQIKQAATLFRQYDIWSYREPLEIQDTDTGNYKSRVDLPSYSTDESDIEEQEFRDFLHQELKLVLIQTIEQEISSCITNLEKSRKYAPLARQYLPGLHLYYAQSLSLREIAPKLGMTSWDQARRILNPGELLNKVRVSTVQILLDHLLKKAHEKGLTKIPPEPDYLVTLTEEIEAFADQEIFQEAGEEIRNSKNRSMNSLYAQELRVHLEKIAQQ